MQVGFELTKNLFRFIKRWGVLLTFVTDDVAMKLDGIRALRVEFKAESTTFKRLTAWENEEKRMRSYKPKSGTVNVLVLHRAMDFVVELIDGVYKEEKSDAKVKFVTKFNG